MTSRSPRTVIPFALALAASLSASTALAIGESSAGFPSYDERAQHMLANRARVEPALEMTECGQNCAEEACYTAQPPLYYKRELNRAARFHAAHMGQNGYFAHNSSCTLVENIGSLYPDQCDGSASCSCVGGENKCSPACTGFSARVGLFGSDAGGEIIASGGSAESGFYLWLYEPTNSTKCEFTLENGHRWLILTSQGAVGFGSDGRYVGDFGGGGEAHKIASGSHIPRQADTVEAWANWFDAAGPSAALVNVDGTCTPMKLTRGQPENGAYEADISGVGSGCHRYFFSFKDSAGNLVTFPEAGSLGIGAEGDCADWSDERPATGAGCDCTPQCGGKQCGDDACGGSCGSCGAGSSCAPDGQCVPDSGAGAGGSGGAGAGGDGNGANDGTSGTEGSCGCAVPGQEGSTGGALALGLGFLSLAAARGRRKNRDRS
jgi:hypothetical protein